MSEQERQRLIKVSLIQQGPTGPNKEKNIENLLKQVDQVAERESPDFMMPVELSTTQYFCGVQENSYFDLAEPIPGPTTEMFAEKAKKYQMLYLLPMFEKVKVEGVYYNSTVVLGSDGKIIEGTMPDGSRVNCYRKNQIPCSAPFKGITYDERFYFREGIGFPVFDTPKARIGIVTCYDRHFPEGWRMVALQGTQIVFCPACSPRLTPDKGAGLEQMYVAEMQTRAHENSIWVCATNRVGIENVAGVKTDFYGLSAIYHPSGEILAQASSTKPEVISAMIDLNEIATTRRFLNYFKHRRPDLYSLVDKPMV